MASYLVTGAAGFIGFHTSMRLLERGDRVIGVDKRQRLLLDGIEAQSAGPIGNNGQFPASTRWDIADLAGLREALGGDKVDRVIHLAAQAGVRYSIDHPGAYVHFQSCRASQHSGILPPQRQYQPYGLCVFQLGLRRQHKAAVQRGRPC